MAHSPIIMLQSGIERWNRWRADHNHEPCSLAEQDLSGGYYFEGDFSNVDLHGANLQRACLIGANFQNANLRNVTLTNAYIDRANFDGAVLAGIDLTGTNVDTSNLRQAMSQPSAAGKENGKPFNQSIVMVTAIAVSLAIALPSAFVAATDVQKTDVQKMAATATDQTVSAPVQRPANSATSLTLVKALTASSQVWAVDTQTQENGHILVASGGAEGDIQIWDGLTGKILQTLTAHDDTVRAIAISPSGQKLVSSSGDGIKVWQPQTGELIYSLPAEPGAPVWAVAISPDGQSLVSGDYAGNLTVWSLESGQQRYRLSLEKPIWSVAIAPDGRSFVSGSEDDIVRHWDIANGELIQSFAGHEDAVRAVAISHDGSTLASGSWDSTVKLWDLRSGQLTATLSGHSDRVVSLAISPDGKTLASSSVDSTLKMWDIPNSRLIKTLDNSDGWVLSVAFDPIEQTLVSGGKNKMLKLWQ